MKKYTGRTTLLLGCLAAGTVLCRWWMIRMPCREFARWALYMAVLDDEICRNELEGNWIGESKIVFPPRAETLQTRYHCFLQQNRKKAAGNSKEKRRTWSSGSGIPGSMLTSPKNGWRYFGKRCCDRLRGLWKKICWTRIIPRKASRNRLGSGGFVLRGAM